jgi:hypothetical protein
VVVTVSVVIGLAFVTYSLTHSTGSLTAHVHGFTGGFERLPGHPFGSGLGTVGVLANLTSTAGQPGISESGLGTIIAQLGLIGLGLFVWLCAVIHRGMSSLAEPRERILGFTLLYAIILNIAFNEVALSPNSSAGYFMILGILAASGATATYRGRLPSRSLYLTEP